MLSATGIVAILKEMQRSRRIINNIMRVSVILQKMQGYKKSSMNLLGLFQEKFVPPQSREYIDKVLYWKGDKVLPHSLL
jgi:hypothetical protein